MDCRSVRASWVFCVIWAALLGGATGQGLYSSCQNYCSKATSECNVTLMDFTNFSDCHSQCMATLTYSNMTQQQNTYGDSVQCRIKHIDVGFETGAVDWHCRHARIDANIMAGSCPDACPCTDNCNYANRTYPQCVLGNVITNNECADFGVLLSETLHGPNSTYYDPYRDGIATDVMAASLLDGQYGGCEAFARYNAMGCFCDMANASWSRQNGGYALSQLHSFMANEMWPALCGVTPNYTACPALAPSAPRVDIGRCWDAANTAAICAFGQQTQSCCAAIARMDALGCFCDSVFYAMLKLDNNLLNLRINLLDDCVPLPAQYNRTVGCDALQADMDNPCTSPPYNRTIKSIAGGERMAAIQELSDLFTKYEDNFQYDSAYADFARVLDADAELHIYGVGSYTGLESFVEYLTVALPDSNGGLWGTKNRYAYDWTLDNHTIGVRLKSHNTFYGGAVNRTLEWINEYTFRPCSDLIVELRVRPEAEFADLLAGGLDRPEHSVEAYCRTILEYCVDPAVREFSSLDDCVTFHSSLPRYECGAAHRLEGNATSCKMRHAYMIPLRPLHHCPHSGKGDVSDDQGKFVCTPQDCSTPATALRVMDPNVTSYLTSAPGDVCALNENSTLLLQLSILAGSPCNPPPQSLAEVYRGPPSNETAAMLRAFCRPAWHKDQSEDSIFVPDDEDAPENLECETMRYNLQLELDRFETVCPGQVARSNSTLASERALLKAAADLVSFHRTVCLAEPEAPNEVLCAGCTAAEMANLTGYRDYTRGECDARGNCTWLDADEPHETTSLLSSRCRQAIHLACSNAHGLSPDFCQSCFFLPPAAGTDCPRAALEWRNATCRANNSASNWFEADPLPHADPYPGDPDYDTTAFSFMKERSEFDFIVVGAGTAGCAVARRLSDAGHSVLVLEEGIDWQRNEDLWSFSRARRKVYYTWKTPLVKNFNSMPNPGLLDRVSQIVAGNALGGTTVVNANLYSRPAQEEFDQFWPDGWKSDDTLGFYRRAENFQCPTDVPENHGTGGPVTITPGTNQTLGSAWVEAAQRAGLDVIYDGAGGANNKSGVFKLQTAFKAGRRQDAFTAYLDPVIGQREGLVVRTGARVVDILVDTGYEEDGRNRAIGVVYTVQGQARVVAYASREVIISAGWMGSPKVLMLSGIGPCEHIEDRGLGCKVDVPGVGQQLSGRPMVTMVFGGQMIPPEEMPQMYTSPEADREWAVNGSGVLDIPIVAIYGKENSMLYNQTRHHNDYLMYFSNLMSQDGENVPLQTLLSMCKICRPFSKGKVELRSPNPSDNPNVHFNFLSDDRDVEVLLACVKRHLDVYKNFRFQGFDLAGLHHMSDDQLRQYIRAKTDFSWHAFGTCRMGDGPLDVVDTSLRVRTFSNLRVIDGSIMPEGPCSGPLATTYMIAERGAELLLGDTAAAYFAGKHVIDSETAARGLGFSLISTLAVLGVLVLGGALARLRGIRAFYRSEIQPRADAAHAAIVNTLAASNTTNQENPLGGLGKHAIATSHFDVQSTSRAVEVKMMKVTAQNVKMDGVEMTGLSRSLDELAWRGDARNATESKAPGVDPAGQAASASPSPNSSPLTNSRKSAATSDASPLTSSRSTRKRGVSSTTSFRRTLQEKERLRLSKDDDHCSIYFSHIRYTTKARKQSQRRRILKNVHGWMRHKELCVVMGSSGSGKTTLLRLLSQRFHDADVRGNLLYQMRSTRVAGSPANPVVRDYVRRNIAFLRQEVSKIAGMTVFETMVFFYTIVVGPQHPDAFRDYGMITRTLAFLGLSDNAHMSVDRLSGGQLRRLQIGTRLLDSPNALFLDEPTSGLDGTTSLKIMLVLRRITEQYGIMVVATLHRPRVEVLDLSDQVYLLNNGSTLYQGRYDRLAPLILSVKGNKLREGACPVTYVLDHEWDGGVQGKLLLAVKTKANKDIVPRLAYLARRKDPNTVEFPERLKVGSVGLVVTTMFAHFAGLGGSPRDFCQSMVEIARKYSSAVTLVGIAALFAVLFPLFLPVDTVSELGVLLGIFLIWGSCTLTVFQVSVGNELIASDKGIFKEMLSDHLVRPVHIVVYWLLRSLAICAVCLVGFVLFYFGLGFRAANFVNSSLVWFLFTLQTCMAVHVFQSYLESDRAQVAFGLWSAIQILFCGVTVPLDVIPAWARWVRFVNPQYYAFSTMLSLELGVGQVLSCGEYCTRTLNMLGYQDADMFVTVGVLCAFFVAWFVLTYLAVRNVHRVREQSGTMQRRRRIDYGELVHERAAFNEDRKRNDTFHNIDVRRILEKSGAKRQASRTGPMRSSLNSQSSMTRPSVSQQSASRTTRAATAGSDVKCQLQDTADRQPQPAAARQPQSAAARHADLSQISEG